MRCYLHENDLAECWHRLRYSGRGTPELLLPRRKLRMAIFAFHNGDQSFAIPYSEFESGAAFTLPDESQVFLDRDRKDEIFQSSSVFKSKTGFVKKDDKWIETATDDCFDATSRSFEANVSRLTGFDTFWCNWSLNNPETELLKSIKGWAYGFRLVLESRLRCWGRIPIGTSN
ncbi:MAG: hypothetical protein ACI87E_004950 [Mariniblastus sp.]